MTSIFNLFINFLISGPPVFVQDEDNEDKVLGSKDAATAQKIRKVSDWLITSRKVSDWLINSRDVWSID